MNIFFRLNKLSVVLNFRRRHSWRDSFLSILQLRKSRKNL